MRRYEPLIGAILAGLRLPCGCERSDIAQEAQDRAGPRDLGVAPGARAVRCVRVTLRARPGDQGDRHRRSPQAPAPHSGGLAALDHRAVQEAVGYR